MTGRQLWICAAFGSLLGLGCLEPIEPTPDSSPLSITPLVEAVSVTRQADGFSFSLPLVIRNIGTRPVYVDLFYRRTEKLVDQKWKLAAESTPTNLARLFAPNESRRIEYVVTYTPGPGYSVLDQVRGVYRVGLHAFYAANQTDPVSATPSYSSPFVLVDPEE